MQVSEILSLKGSTLFTVTPDMMLSDCVVTMAEQDIGSLVVMENGKLAGMLTFREVLKVLAKRQAERRSGPTPPVAATTMAAFSNAFRVAISRGRSCRRRSSITCSPAAAQSASRIS